MFFGSGNSCNLGQIEASGGWVAVFFFLFVWRCMNLSGEKCNPIRAQELIWVN